jgi:hypothetical protein
MLMAHSVKASHPQCGNINRLVFTIPGFDLQRSLFDFRGLSCPPQAGSDCEASPRPFTQHGLKV